MTAAAFPRTPHLRVGLALSTMTTPLRQACAVRLIDRRTGQTHRVDGSPLLLFTRDPAAAVAELLDGRDPLVWEARVEVIGSGGRA
jgi:hypothetical protein